VGGKACAEGREPDCFCIWVGGEGLLEGGEDTRAADVSVAVEGGARFFEGVGGEALFNGVNDVAAAGVGDKSVWWGGCILEELEDGICGECGDFAVQLVF